MTSPRRRTATGGPPASTRCGTTRRPTTRRCWEENNAWLEAVLAAADLVCWAKLICFAAVPSLARCEIAAFRYRGAACRRPAHPLGPHHPAAHRPHLAVGGP